MNRLLAAAFVLLLLAVPSQLFAKAECRTICLPSGATSRRANSGCGAILSRRTGFEVSFFGTCPAESRRNTRDSRHRRQSVGTD
jgi:hypothetical protein